MGPAHNRWAGCSGEAIRKSLIEFTQKAIAKYVEDPDLVAESICEKLEPKIGTIPLHIRQQVHEKFHGTEGKVFLANFGATVIQDIGSVLDASSFSGIASGALEKLTELISAIGIFSVSEMPDNRQLWALYASEGRGYVVEFYGQHGFFWTTRDDGTRVNSLRKVMYTDRRLSDFWENPYFLVLVKDQGWSFEKEWRVVRKLEKCTPIGVHDGDEIYVQDVVPGMISSVIFGYHYDPTHMKDDLTAIRTFDPAIKSMRVVINRSSGQLTLEGI